MNEKREIKQIEVKNEKGELEYTIIPNYRVHKNFMTESEIKFYKFLIRAILEIKEKYNINLTIFSQVALNRIIDVNNERKKSELFEKISRKSIDFVLYSENEEKIKCCIELDDETHKTEERVERDILLDKIFKDNIKLLHIKRDNYYNMEEIIELIIN